MGMHLCQAPHTVPLGGAIGMALYAITDAGLTERTVAKFGDLGLLRV
jgi:hypothetical protein